MRERIELNAQIADEGKWLQEAQERLDNARQIVGPKASSSVSRQLPVVLRSPVVSKSPAFSVASGQDINSAVDAFIESILDPTNRNTALGNRKMFEDSQTFLDNSTNDHAPARFERVQRKADLLISHQPYIPEPGTSIVLPGQSLTANGDVKREFPPLLMGDNHAAPGLSYQNIRSTASRMNRIKPPKKRRGISPKKDPT
ncbi:hypothetical protein N7466_001418 [Penicillium verhagenii]|uniref:uncharacterized protein n=1 Tax=Penicillium verhagenii TaxID=1562060 RepID=UPI0025458F31|nr:uncharacterized protein N7466_001418 [Penicillium verhagenii]KAJ5938284.1 hypothetical protein N7466_001418 [Penicillium verhagenii]